MNNRHILSFLLTVILGVSATMGQTVTSQPPAKAAPNPFLRMAGNGAWWTSLSDDVKDIFVDGYVTAMARVNHMIGAQCLQAKNTIQPGPKFDADMQTTMTLCENANFFDFSVDERLDRQKVKNGLDEFYKDSLNTRIPIDYAMQQVKDILKGRKSPRELEDQLKAWRDVINK